MPRRFLRWPSGLTVLAGAMLLFFAARLWRPGRIDSQAQSGISSATSTQFALAKGPCEFIRALDGNTVLVSQNGRLFRVRLLGVSGNDDSRALATLSDLTFSQEASVKQNVELDKRRAAADSAWLAYLFADGQLLNAALLRAGWGRYEPYPGDSASHGRQLRDAEAAARREKLGMWAAP